VPRRGYIFTADVTRHEHAELRPQQGGPEVVTEHVLAERPSIAVLAFTSMSGDPDQEYFSDGITEDIITELSRFSELLVIARNSSFRYKGQSVDVRQVARELGRALRAGGSVRRARQPHPHQCPAYRRHDRRPSLGRCATIGELSRTPLPSRRGRQKDRGGCLRCHVDKAETERALAKPPAVWQAYDHYLRALILTRSFIPHSTKRTSSRCGAA